MLNLSTSITLSSEQINLINSFGTLKVEDWDRNKTKLKDKIRKDLKILQDGRCVYCGCKYFGSGDVEHIAHKATHTEFMFTPKNLAYACKTCNSTYKGSKEVVITSNIKYEKCTFSIVHPYLDDVDHFFDTSKPLIMPRATLVGDEKTKAKATASLLQWELSEVVERRAAMIAAENYAHEHKTSISEIAYENTLTFIP